MFEIACGFAGDAGEMCLRFCVFSRVMVIYMVPGRGLVWQIRDGIGDVCRDFWMHVFGDHLGDFVL